MIAVFPDRLEAEFLSIVDHRPSWRRFLFTPERRIRLNKRFRMQDSRGRIWKAEAGFISNGTSIPQLLWHVIGHPFGELLEVAIIHDLLYQTGTLSRNDADLVLLDGMESLNIPKAKRFIVYHGVRLFGASRYNTPPE